MKHEKMNAEAFFLQSQDVIETEACQEELTLAQEQWNKIYGGICKIVDWEFLGETTGRRSVEAYLKWLESVDLVLAGNVFDPGSMTLLSIPEGRPLEWSPEQIFEITALLRVPSIIFRVRWEDVEGKDFYTYALGHREGLGFDPLMAGAILVEDRIIPPTERNTDIFHKDFGWIWQSKGNKTRGYVHAEVTVICSGGQAIASRFFTSHKMSIGSSDIKILPSPPALAGACASTTYTWAVATATITATVVIAGGTLTATFSGSFGSTAGGSGSLLDCCPLGGPPTVPTPVSLGSKVILTTPNGVVVSVSPDAPPPEEIQGDVHRGRLQVQGEDLDLDISWRWTRSEPPTKREAQRELDNLRTKLTSRQFKRRNQAFDKAQRFIRQAPATGVDAVVIESYYNNPRDPKYPEARVDVEVREGKAFKD
jgi:hypothetical protein